LRRPAPTAPGAPLAPVRWPTAPCTRPSFRSPLVTPKIWDACMAAAAVYMTCHLPPETGTDFPSPSRAALVAPWASSSKLGLAHGAFRSTRHSFATPSPSRALLRTHGPVPYQPSDRLPTGERHAKRLSQASATREPPLATICPLCPAPGPSQPPPHTLSCALRSAPAA
jgi:hypothetical protein